MITYYIHFSNDYSSEYDFLDVDLLKEMSISDLSILNEDTETINDILTETKNDNLDATSLKIQLTKKIVRHSLNHKQSYQGLEDLAKILNSTPGGTVQIPVTKYKIKKMILPLVKTEFYMQCASCKEYTMSHTSTAECHSCMNILKTAHSKYFTYLPIKPQLMNTLNKHIDDIVAYDQNFQVFEGTIRDVQDGLQYRKIRENYPDSIVLSLSVNTDGARIYNSTNKSLWPIQLYQNFLRPKMRYVPDNIIVAAMHEGTYRHIFDA